MRNRTAAAISVAFITFSSHVCFAAGNLVDGPDADLIYDWTTGQVILDPIDTSSGRILSFVIATTQSNMLTANTTFPFVDIGTNTDNRTFQIGQYDPLNQGVPQFTLGHIFPTGIATTPEGLENYLSLAEYTSDLIGGGTLDLIVTPAVRTGDFDLDSDTDGTDFLMWQRGESPDPLSSDDLAFWQTQYIAANNPPLYSQTLIEQSPLDYWGMNVDVDFYPARAGFQFHSSVAPGSNSILTANLTGTDVAQSSSPGLNTTGGFPGLDPSNRWTTMDGTSNSALNLSQFPVEMNSLSGSVSFWIKSAGSDVSQILYYGTDTPEGESIANGFGSANELHLHMDPEGRLGLFINGDSSFTNLTSSGFYNDDLWHHVAGTWDVVGDEVVLYIDGGSEVGGETVSGAHFGNSFIFSTHQNFGKPVANQRFFNGSVDELAIWDTPLSAAQVQQQYLAAVGLELGLSRISEDLAVVPEPSSFTLILVGLVAFRRRP